MAVDPKLNLTAARLRESFTATGGASAQQSNVPSVVPEQQRTASALEEGGGGGGGLKQFMADFVVSAAAGQNPIFGAFALGIKRRREEAEEETNRLAFEAAQSASKRAIEAQGNQQGPVRLKTSVTRTITAEGDQSLSITTSAIPTTSIERFTNTLNATGNPALATLDAPDIPARERDNIIMRYVGQQFEALRLKHPELDDQQLMQLVVTQDPEIISALPDRLLKMAIPTPDALEGKEGELIRNMNRLLEQEAAETDPEKLRRIKAQLANNITNQKALGTRSGQDMVFLDANGKPFAIMGAGTALGRMTINDAQKQILSNAGQRFTMQRILVHLKPGTLGGVGAIKRFAQNARVQIAAARRELFNVLKAEGADIDFDRHFDESLAVLPALLKLLAITTARANESGAKALSDQDIENAETIIGSRGALANVPAMRAIFKELFIQLDLKDHLARSTIPENMRPGPAEELPESLRKLLEEGSKAEQKLRGGGGEGGKGGGSSTEPQESQFILPPQ